MTGPGELRWQDPPTRPSRAQLADYDAIARALRRNAGRWALVLEGARSQAAAYQLRRRGCDVVTFRNLAGGFDIYACWPEGAEQ